MSISPLLSVALQSLQFLPATSPLMNFELFNGIRYRRAKSIPQRSTTQNTEALLGPHLQRIPQSLGDARQRVCAQSQPLERHPTRGLTGWFVPELHSAVLFGN